VQFEIATGQETGVTLDVGSIASVGSGIAGGLCISDAFVEGFYTICGTAQNVDIWGLELCISNSNNWVNCNTFPGIVSGNGGTVEIPIEFNSAGLAIGDEYTANLLIHNNSNLGEDYILPVTLHVIGFEPPTNLYVDEILGLFTWDPPLGTRELVGYHVFLDDMTNYIGMTTNEEWQFSGLVLWQSYIAGVSAVYDDGESEVVQYPFTCQQDSSDPTLPLITELQGNFPNPFNPETTISFSTTNTHEMTRIEIYNIKGQKIKILVDEILEPGYHSVVWDGKDSSGKNVSSGIYFFKMKSGDYTSNKKMILMK
jgi:hypothetical protein